MNRLLNSMLFISILTITMPGFGANLLLETQTIYPNQFAYIIQTESDFVKLTNPVLAIYTDVYTGPKFGLWLNVVGISESKSNLARYKAQYPNGYIKNLGQYRQVRPVNYERVDLPKSNWILETQGFFISDSQYKAKGTLYHLVKFWDSNINLAYVDSFSISLDAVQQVNTRIFRTKTNQVILVRDYSSSMIGSVSDIRIFKNIGQTKCGESSITNDGGPDDPMTELEFDKQTDKPVLTKFIHEKAISHQPIPCKDIHPMKSSKSINGTWRSSNIGCDENANFQIINDSAYYTDRDPQAVKIKSDTLAIGDEKYLFKLVQDTLQMQPLGTNLKWLYINRKCE